MVMASLVRYSHQFKLVTLVKSIAWEWGR